MTNNELFINATRANYQFPFRGMINVIDLWDFLSQIWTQYSRHSMQK